MSWRVLIDGKRNDQRGFSAAICGDLVYAKKKDALARANQINHQAANGLICTVEFTTDPPTCSERR